MAMKAFYLTVPIQYVLKPFKDSYIIFDIQDIAFCLKQDHYAFRHLGYSYLSSDISDVTTW